MDKQICAIVPLKAHSERIPRKNFREFNGQPLFHWILYTLDNVKEIETILIDTDSPEVAESAPSLVDCTVVDRPERLQGDRVAMNDILLYDVEQVNADYYLQTHCTNPLLQPGTISEALKSFLDAPDHNSLFSVTPMQTRLWDEQTEPINHERDRLLPTQELPMVYEENSNLYIFSQDSLERRENRIGDDPLMFPIDPEEAVDIDEMIDFNIAEFLHHDMYGSEPTDEDLVAVWEKR
jgi:CMP-N-acetylneuraminic acid synthetase